MIKNKIKQFSLCIIQEFGLPVGFDVEFDSSLLVSQVPMEKKKISYEKEV